jgi:hypothetical protein
VPGKPAESESPLEDRTLSALNQAILEHLEVAGHARAAQVLKEELTRPKQGPGHRRQNSSQGVRTRSEQSARDRKDPVYGKMSPQQLLGAIQQSFDQGEKSDFFRAFDMLVPLEVKKKDFAYKKLEFYLQIYFVVFRRHPSLSRVPHAPATVSSDQEFADAQAEFKRFLDSKGSELSKANEFLAYYALPYIPNPASHPSFKHLFTMDWVQDLKLKLRQFIQANASRLGLAPPGMDSGLFAIFKDHAHGAPDGGEEGAENREPGSETLQGRLKLMQKNMVVLQRKEAYSKRMLYESQLKWTNFSQDVVRKCKELILALEQAGISEYQLFSDQQNPGVRRQLDHIKTRINKFDVFLKNNSRELTAKGICISPASGTDQQQVIVQQPERPKPVVGGAGPAGTGPQPSFFSDASSIPVLQQNEDEYVALLRSHNDSGANAQALPATIEADGQPTGE